MSFLYIISHPQGWLKVGRAKSPAARLGQHQQFSGATLRGEFVFPCASAIQAERQALAALSVHRIMGEWFLVDIETARAVIERVTGANAQPFPASPGSDRDRIDPTALSVTPAQVRTARALLDWTQNDLARAAKVSRLTVVRFEKTGDRTNLRSLAAMRDTLSSAGVLLCPASDGIGEGARMAKPDV